MICISASVERLPVRRAARRLGPDRRGALGARRAATVGMCSAAALALGVPFHGGLFGHAAHAHGAAAPSTWLSILTEFVLDLPIAIAIAVAVSKASMANLRGLGDTLRNGWRWRSGVAATVLMMTGTTALVIMPKVQAVTTPST